MYENLKILILGAAKSGIAVAKLLSGKNNKIILSDIKKLDDKVTHELEKLGIKVVIGNQLELIDSSFDLIIKNPAILYTSDLMKKCRKLHLRVENEMEVAYHFLPKDITIIGVTGSNGKTTTVTMIYELLQKMGKKVILGGNIGFPLASIVNEVKSGDILLLEISDHQLVDFNNFKTDISVLTNLCPTHLDYHGTYEHYKYTKKNIFNHHTKNELAIINAKNNDSLEITAGIDSTKIYFNNEHNYFTDEGIFIDDKLVLKKDDILLQGNHNYENILCCLLVIKRFCFDVEIIKEYFKKFGGVEHRLEYVTKINDVIFYNDSKATNPTATIIALKTFNKPIRLILGGMERNQDFNELNDYLGKVIKIYAIGTVTDRIYNYALDRKIECVKCYKLASAMKEIRQDMKSGEVVLLSTASSSQDQYLRFEDRGAEFKNILQKWDK